MVRTAEMALSMSSASAYAVAFLPTRSVDEISGGDGRKEMKNEDSTLTHLRVLAGIRDELVVRFEAQHGLASVATL